jgi:hypothetical protein
MRKSVWTWLIAALFAMLPLSLSGVVGCEKEEKSALDKASEAVEEAADEAAEAAEDTADDAEEAIEEATED